MASIDELLNLLKNPLKPESNGNLKNTADTWDRIGKKDKFQELGLKGSALEEFLKEWVESNPYSNIS